MTITATPIQGIRTLSYPPRVGEHYLSINLALVDDVAAVFEIATELGFKPQLVQITTRSTTEIHALLFHEQCQGALISTPDLDDKIDRLADHINEQAIRHTYGGRMVA
jgi:hypothetical protein